MLKRSETWSLGGIPGMDSFVKDLLAKQLKFNESNLRSYGTPEEFDKALSNGTVAAIFDEIPYINVFLAQYCSRYMMIGPTYKTDGFGFGNTERYSRIKIKWRPLKRRTLGTIANCEGHGDTAKIPSNTTDLSVHSFGGPFIITGAASIFSRSESRVHPVAIPEGNDASPDHDIDDMQNHPRMGSDSGEEDVEAGNEHDDEASFFSG
ncbi:hypothetical protein Patl1_14396 [Pistacia atlantica]|uniref:Uncharacterized protein n=1 Tax=Pistacia atlantica TaxID=434234 RepID=A0ACC1AX72_9ROSI|nr:hypothetical protein Patl1_14396 [Pistacia atlantica]